MIASFHNSMTIAVWMTFVYTGLPWLALCVWIVPQVNKIQRLGRILDDKVEVFDDLQRRMEELNTNARLRDGEDLCDMR